MAEEIKPGDVVRVKSGGPTMTVADIANYSMTGDTEMKARCTWFDAKHKLETSLFELHMLEKVR